MYVHVFVGGCAEAGQAPCAVDLKKLREATEPGTGRRTVQSFTLKVLKQLASEL